MVNHEHVLVFWHVLAQGRHCVWLARGAASRLGAVVVACESKSVMSEVNCRGWVWPTKTLDFELWQVLMSANSRYLTTCNAMKRAVMLDIPMLSREALSLQAALTSIWKVGVSLGLRSFEWRQCIIRSSLLALPLRFPNRNPVAIMALEFRHLSEGAFQGVSDRIFLGCMWTLSLGSLLCGGHDQAHEACT